MGEDHAGAERDVPSIEPLTAEHIAGTWCHDTGVAIRNDAAPRDATAATERPPPPAPPASGRFRVLRELGRGGMGRVEEVFDAVLGRSVAQKSVLPGAGFLPTTLLVSEAQTCAQLEHPSIVPVYDFGPSADGSPQYTMRLVRGRTLREILDEKEAVGLFSTQAQRLGVLRQVCLAVAYAHERGVIHRDLKPDNVICGEFGEVYVLDWGIAQLVEGSDVRRAQHADVQAGSPGYMAPEQVLGMKVSFATDAFALGALLYEIVTGERAFEDRDLPSILRRCSVGLDSPPSSKNAKAPRAFDALIASCLDNDVSARPSARSIATAIDAYLDGERARAERAKEADQLAIEGEEARDEFESLTGKARDMRERSRAALEAIPVWESAEKKAAGWALSVHAAELGRDAARSLARAQTAFARALGRVAEHERARRGLASLHYRLFRMAEADSDDDAMAQHLELARVYDSGELALELANEGVLIVEATRSAHLELHRFVDDGLRRVPRKVYDLAAGGRQLLEAGSYVVVATPADGGAVIRYPIRVERAKLLHLRLRVPRKGELPDGFILVPGGPYLGAADPKATRFIERSLPDYAIGRFPVTWREYTAFLDDLGEQSSSRVVAGEQAIIVKEDGRWRITPYAVEGPARARIPAGSELELPCSMVSWFDATAFARWRGERDGRPYRLPSENEWEKALRGADGRRFAMGNHLDPCLAKLRESRPELHQPEVIGAFPLDESPYGVRDLTGGVGDWTSTLADAPSASTDESPTNETPIVWRGGCYGTTALFPHAMRYTEPAQAKLPWVGFRLALSLEDAGSSELTVEPMRRR